MKKIILLCLILTLLIITITSCQFLDPDPVEIVHNPKNLLFVESSDKTFTKRVVFIRFTSPEVFGATSYAFEFSPFDDPDNFTTVLHESNPFIITTQAAVSADLELPVSDTSGYFRLLITGGDHDGEYSNIEYATQCTVNADINWGLDYSVFIANYSGIMSPHVGFGIEASFTLIDDADNEIVDGLTYAWYRVNPNNYEDRELISGETGLTYTTQTADIDHYILVVATGTNEKFSGGLCNAMTDFIVTR